VQHRSGWRDVAACRIHQAASIDAGCLVGRMGGCCCNTICKPPPPRSPSPQPSNPTVVASRMRAGVVGVGRSATQPSHASQPTWPTHTRRSSNGLGFRFFPFCWAACRSAEEALQGLLYVFCRPLQPFTTVVCSYATGPAHGFASSHRR